MKRIFTLSLLLTSSVVWSVSSLKVQNFNFMYSDGTGSGTASEFEIVTSQTQVLVNRVGSDLEFSSAVLETPFVWRNAPQMILDSKVTVTDFNLNLNKDFKATITRGEFESEKKMTIQNGSAQCQRLQGVDAIEQVINGCLAKGVVKFSNFESRSLDAFIAALTDTVEPESTQIRSLTLNLDKKNFNLTASAKFGVNGTLRAKGTADVDYQNKKAVFKVNEVKFGFLNITGKFFTEIEKMDVKGLEVRRPYIYLSL
ncbi:MAG TPA: hypothetical protein VKY27_12535 [Bacteriovoracaceae bacterium]|nr:hypothetical protein [Bacteriovoracaceae bacterium]